MNGSSVAVRKSGGGRNFGILSQLIRYAEFLSISEYWANLCYIAKAVSLHCCRLRSIMRNLFKKAIDCEWNWSLAIRPCHSSPSGSSSSRLRQNRWQKLLNKTGRFDIKSFFILLFTQRCRLSISASAPEQTTTDKCAYKSVGQRMRSNAERSPLNQCLQSLCWHFQTNTGLQRIDFIEVHISIKNFKGLVINEHFDLLSSIRFIFAGNTFPWRYPSTIRSV